MPNPGTRAHSRRNIIWHILFFDVFILSIRQGGFTLYDLLFHAICLILATALLVRGDRVYPLPKAAAALGAALLLLGLIQLIPLPAGLFEVVAPIKARIVSEATSIFPEISYSTQISLIPKLHVMRLASLGLDVYLVILLLMTPPPSRKLFDNWVYVLALTVNSLLLMKNGTLFEGDGLLSMYADSYGGLINSNHYSVLNCVFMVLLMQKGIGAFHSVFRAYRKGDLDNKQKLVTDLWAGSFSLFCYFVCLLAFQNVGSRSGIILIVISHILFVGLFVSKRLLVHGTISWPVVTGGILALLAVMALIPFGESIDKFQTYGLDDLERVEASLVGLGYLSEAPLLGAGLGASAGLLDSAMPNFVHTEMTWTHFHNDFIEVAVEFGALGMIAFVIFFGGLFLLLRSDGRRLRMKQELLLNGLIVMVMVFSISAAVTFPLRVTSVRIFFLIALGAGIQMSSSEKSRRLDRDPVLAVFFLTLLIATGVLCHGLYRARTYQGPESAATAVIEGGFYKAGRIEAALMFGETVSAEMTDEKRSAAYKEVRARFLSHLYDQPNSVRALNGLAALDIMTTAMDGVPFERQRFETLYHNCKKISDMASPRNFQAKISLFYLLQLNESILNAEEKALLKELQETQDHVQTTEE